MPHTRRDFLKIGGLSLAASGFTSMGSLVSVSRTVLLSRKMVVLFLEEWSLSPSIHLFRNRYVFR